MPFAHYSSVAFVIHKNVDYQMSLCLISRTQTIYQECFTYWIYIRTWDLLNTVQNFTEQERFLSLASDLISPTIQINCGEADETACVN